MQAQAADGTIHEFPDGTDISVIDRVMKQYAAGGAQPAAPTNVTGADPSDQNPPGGYPASAPAGVRPQVGVQGAGAGLAELVSMPFDLAAGGQNALVMGINKLLGTKIPMATPASSMLKRAASAGAEAIGVPTIDPAEMSANEQLSYNINRFGAQAAGAIPLLASRAAVRTGEIAAGSAPKAFDALVKPYAGENVGRTVIGDAAAAAGAGTGVTVADEAGYKDNPLVQTLAALAGGVGGMTIPQVVERGGRAVASAAGRPFGGSIDKSINIDPTTGAPVTKAVSDRASTMVQDAAVNPADAAIRMKDNAAELRGLSADAPMPSPAALSEDPGLSALERRIRMANPGQAMARDREFNSAVRDTVDRVAPADADASALLQRAQTRPTELAAARDAEALPYLRKAEASGVPVDATPVATLIDTKLADAKRPPVKNALAEARKMLNKAGTEELDTSVSGLYETRKAINDIIEGRSDNPTGRYAKKELLDVKAALDAEINKASPEFGQYLTKYREGSRPLNAVQDSAAVKLALDSDPNKAVFAVMSQPHRSERLLGELIDLTKNDPASRDGLKAAVRDYLVEKATTGASEKLKPGDRRGPVSQAKLSGIFREHEKQLAQVFSPEEMNTLRAGNRALELTNIERLRVSSGSDTAEKTGSMVEQFLGTGLGKGVEAALRLKYGLLKAGGIVSTVRRVTSGVTGGPQPAEVVRLVERAAADPELMGLLLGRKLPVGSPAWNAKMQRLLAVGEGARDSEAVD